MKGGEENEAKGKRALRGVCIAQSKTFWQILHIFSRV